MWRAVLSFITVTLLMWANKLLGLTKAALASSMTAAQMNGTTSTYVFSAFLNTTSFGWIFVVLGFLLLLWIWYKPLCEWFAGYFDNGQK